MGSQWSESPRPSRVALERPAHALSKYSPFAPLRRGASATLPGSRLPPNAACEQASCRSKGAPAHNLRRTPSRQSRSTAHDRATAVTCARPGTKEHMPEASCASSRLCACVDCVARASAPGTQPVSQCTNLRSIQVYASTLGRARVPPPQRIIWQSRVASNNFASGLCKAHTGKPAPRP